MDSVRTYCACALGFLLSSAFLANAAQPQVTNSNLPPCDYPAIYNFGDSNSDTGGIAAAFYPPVSPCGQTYFHRPAGRGCDGRLIIDFIADHLGLPYLSSYLDAIGANYRHGANFATGGATILRPNGSGSWFVTGDSPFSLEIQVAQYNQFKDRTSYFRKANKFRESLPKPNDFSKAIFTLDIGQNDVAAIIRSRSSFRHQRASVTQIVHQFSEHVRNLYKKGARTFWVHSTGPIGCLPVAIIKELLQEPAKNSLDEHGCVQKHNDIALEFNKQLKHEIVRLRSQLSRAVIIYVDMYRAKHELITNAKSQGFENPFKICCGHHGKGYDVWCGNKARVNGSKLFGGSCKNPSRVISWDGVHYTEAANNWIAKQVVGGLLSDPPIAISRACHKDES